MSFKRLKPTKTNIIALEKRLKFARKGQNFLEYKREQLIFQIKKTWEDFLIQRKKFLDLYRKSLLKLTKAYKKMGKRDFSIISKLSTIQYEPEFSVKYVKKIGNVFSQIDYQLLQSKKLPPYSFEFTSTELDDLIELLKEFFENLILLAEREDILLKYAMNFKRLNRRLNGLKNKFIPDLQSEIKKLKGMLEEMERENFVRLKKVKDLINKKQEIS
ncbi:MAG: V-type ATP synthase subunit D [Candidatus Lokiarchaeota archaeon]|nr:V-type ATP synthase subunit D [Candidatus Lokiarchaeota archaeon]MBD3339263.1 V-type ATP synthase subunit D [Candidatus Lokiarchaeota archaeon]